VALASLALQEVALKFRVILPQIVPQTGYARELGAAKGSSVRAGQSCHRLEVLSQALASTRLIPRVGIRRINLVIHCCGLFAIDAMSSVQHGRASAMVHHSDIYTRHFALCCSTAVAPSRGPAAVILIQGRTTT
jgi:hypothetical protein